MLYALLAGGLYSYAYTLDSSTPKFWVVMLLNVIFVALLRKPN